MGIVHNGVQYENCDLCGKSVRFDSLGYEPPSPHYKHGRDICLACTNTHPQMHSIVPAKTWRRVYDCGACLSK